MIILTDLLNVYSIVVQAIDWNADLNKQTEIDGNTIYSGS